MWLGWMYSNGLDIGISFSRGLFSGVNSLLVSGRVFQDVLNVCESRVLIQSPRHAAENSQQRLGGQKKSNKDARGKHISLSI